MMTSNSYIKQQACKKFILALNNKCTSNRVLQLEMHFNKNARQYAANKNIELIDGDTLINMMNSRS
ncbi:MULTISPECIES: restriction endonuclease [Bacillus cereus group]|uniref:restriction endonuclease n=1 Tax=Bacillus cereus group TaxID=86661 RepID=UPI0027DFA481|nr:restriction endonuclease [Bacillus cereus group sp. BfR-BA-01310]